MPKQKFILIFFLFITTTIMIKGEMKPKHCIVEVKTDRAEQDPEKDIFPDVIFFMNYLYQ